MAGALAYQATITPSYSSTVDVVVSPALATPDSASGVSGLELEPTIVDDPGVVAAATATLGTPPDQLGRVTAVVNGNTVTITAAAGSPTTAQDLANAYAPAVAGSITTQVPAYLDQLAASVAALTKQAEAIGTGGNNPLLQQAQSDVIVAQFSAAFQQQIAAQAASSAPVTVPDPAEPGILTTLSRTLALEVALLAGLIVGVGLALIRNWLDGRIDDAVDVQNLVDVPVVGVLPLDKGLSRIAQPTVSTGDQSGALVEDIRRMRTAATGVLSRKAGSVILVTSLREDDGATFVAANLGAASARAGHLTVVASGDLRNPELAEYFGIVDSYQVQAARNGRSTRPASGAAHASPDGAAAEPGAGVDGPYLNGLRSVPVSEEVGARQRLGLRSPSPASPTGGLRRRDLPSMGARPDLNPAGYEPAIHSSNGSVTELRLRPTGVDGLSMLLSLVGPGEGADALAGERVRAIIEAARVRSELVVIDSPPLLDVADPLILAPYADLVIVVAKSHSTRSKDLNRAVGILKQSGVSSVGVVVNSVKRRRLKNSGAPISPDRSAGVRRRAAENN